LTQNVAKMSDRARVFLSHSSADRKVAADIAKHLADSGVQVWTDAMINPGENFVSAIESAIKDSDFLVLLVGDDLLSSRNVMYELGSRLIKPTRLWPRQDALTPQTRQPACHTVSRYA
jgi:predicted nucleotide-binding protein